MTGTTLHMLKLKRRPRLALTLLCLFAYVTQSFVAQTHVHAAAKCSETMFAAQDCADSGIAKHNSGSNAGCPLCQVVLHGGTAPLLPHALSLPTIAGSAHFSAEQPSIASIAAISYHWQSRGPPLS